MEGRKLELAFIDKHGKVYPLDEATHEELAKGLEKISKEIAETAIVERTKIEPGLSLFSGNSRSARISGKQNVTKSY